AATPTAAASAPAAATAGAAAERADAAHLGVRRAAPGQQAGRHQPERRQAAKIRTHGTPHRRLGLGTPYPALCHAGWEEIMRKGPPPAVIPIPAPPGGPAAAGGRRPRARKGTAGRLNLPAVPVETAAPRHRRHGWLRASSFTATRDGHATTMVASSPSSRS